MYLRYDTKTLSSSLPEQDGRADLQELGPVHKPELDLALVARAEEVRVHLENLGRLSDDTAVNHGLIVGFNGGCVMQDHHLGIEVVH